jgi:putative transposase
MEAHMAIKKDTLAAGKRNSRNGYSKKTVLTETSKLGLRIPRDREGTFVSAASAARRDPGASDGAL